MIWALVLVSCGRTTVAEIDAVPQDITDASCAACGMIVGEQPAPRGQIVYRDGTYAHACSIGDLRALVQAPSPHGSPRAVFVEVLPDGFDPTSNAATPLDTRPAEDVWFVFGATRPLVMGLPVLTYAERPAAEAVAATLSGTVVGWSSVAETPFDQVPAGG